MNLGEGGKRAVKEDAGARDAVGGMFLKLEQGFGREVDVDVPEMLPYTNPIRFGVTRIT